MQKKPRNTLAKQEILNLITTTNHALSHIEIQQKLNNLCDREITCVENVVPQFSMPTEYQVDEINITVSGICPRCK